MTEPCDKNVHSATISISSLVYFSQFEEAYRGNSISLTRLELFLGYLGKYDANIAFDISKMSRRAFFFSWMALPPVWWVGGIHERGSCNDISEKRNQSLGTINLMDKSCANKLSFKQRNGDVAWPGLRSRSCPHPPLTLWIQAIEVWTVPCPLAAPENVSSIT